METHFMLLGIFCGVIVRIVGLVLFAAGGMCFVCIFLSVPPFRHVLKYLRFPKEMTLYSLWLANKYVGSRGGLIYKLWALFLGYLLLACGFLVGVFGCAAVVVVWGVIFGACEIGSDLIGAFVFSILHVFMWKLILSLTILLKEYKSVNLFWTEVLFTRVG